MKTRFRRASLVVCLWAAFACHGRDGATQARTADGRADAVAIEALLKEFVRSYNAEDFERLRAVFYADDAVLMTPGNSPRKGKDAILLGLKKQSGSYSEHIDRSVVEEVRVSGDLAVARGTDTGITTLRSGGKPVPYDLKWVLVFERQLDGAWKCLYEIWNDNPLVDPESAISSGRAWPGP